MEHAILAEGLGTRKTTEVRTELPKIGGFQPLCMENYEWTIEKDAELGYRPRFDHIEGPVPFVFLSHTQAAVIRMMEELGETLVYRSYRPKNSFEVHQTNLKSGSMYEVLDPSFKLLTDKTVQNIILNPGKDAPFRKKRSDAQIGSSKCIHEPSQGKKGLDGNDHLSPSQHEFDSEFEGGNLDLVFKASDSEYSLLTRCDTNSKGHNQGFYFKIKAKVDQDVRLNIINMVKPKSLFGGGSFPYYGYRDKEGKLVWQQLGPSCKIAYSRTPQKYQFNQESQKKRIYMNLSFSLKMEAGQERWLAYSIPYSYSDLLSYLNKLSGQHFVIQPGKTASLESIGQAQARKNALFFRKWESPFIRMESLCKSESLLEVPLLTITDFTPSEVAPMAFEHRPVVYIVSRVHPSESVSSYSIEGFISKLIDGSPFCRALLKLLIFKIVPMINPDGVVVGNFRTNLSGEDLNRRYDAPSRAFHPTVRASDPDPPAEGSDSLRYGCRQKNVCHVRLPWPQFAAQCFHIWSKGDAQQPKEPASEVSCVSPCDHDRYVPFQLLHLEGRPS
jgi:hypothetical protein